MDKYSISFENIKISKYEKIAQHIKKLIDKNIIKDGEKLPSIRKLAVFLKVNNTTIVNAYKKLEEEGYATQKVGSGTYAKRKEISININKKYGKVVRKINLKGVENYIDFSGEAACSDTFPIEPFKKVINEVLDRDGTKALVYQEALGYEGLRNSINKYFWNDKIDINNILVVSGAQQGIDIVSKSIVNVSDNIIIERPTYGGAIAVFKWRRANILEVPMEEDGMDLDYLEDLVKKNKVKIVYVMSYFQNPTGIVYSLQKKQRLLNMAEIYDFYIIEDDYLSELIYNDDKYISFKSMDRNDRVIYIKSFSKIFLPGIRLGYMITPNKFRDVIQNSKINTDIATSSLMQRVLDIYIRKDVWKGYIEKLNSMYKSRYLFIKDNIKDLEKYLDIYVPTGGLHIYATIKNPSINCLELFKILKEEGVLITPGVIFYKKPEEGMRYFRISFSQTSIEDIKKGFKIIEKVLKEWN
ncbi:PLP-dependent aminotransferase family protein [Clostridium cochlearium]|uniref:GntR family transcriptional regulator n=1 Tax=Clostridium cochlearium TaxID=1494 RepID=A0A240ASG5_CLOCO|nr:PLP-dependent aminotransferase family protein [Clostridium cochlearium]MBV1820837.1 PLP-dependent aminotransferase family protein [Bacteroidales bacterium MSK.15.36]NSJ92222.1 PLP-dependent aminotransferase family protein [Coprococcus sp. MSK.21.13]MCG4572066.1 PLP-dependent aminotransferase family protein [Clostridium cochlearium]MCG4579817.1 PLP-dependent aminotransferase family protein [Clostridium cochlearium]MCR1970830.1 PLP-dependent aminotransferase family protein [Clostridium cochle